ncbi:phage baseplate upper protein [Carnobacterium maltaromaticum]|uniref:phage baseplate upper protein n=1 Tax=Carnobacterium maltaromaticum TaxID=2751 RepID=UPI001071CE55|nr:phage baseplate upper protein [Carnobacterium maltaromaticum]TFJ71876.1 hypothetical protein CKN94_11800 [Carnobacterium maltaromaticum]TFJ76789.1 hypothetical protein CKN97_11790 [Carnobacterium maltaromaticum]
MIDYPVRLSTTEPNNPVGVLKIRQDDKGTQKIVARITTNSKPQDLTGLEVAFNMRTNDGNVVIEKAVVKDAKLGIIEYVVSGYATQQAGRNNAYFSFFIGENEEFSTKDFSYFVTNSVTSEGIKGCDYIWRFEDLLEYVTDLANQSTIILKNLSDRIDLLEIALANVDFYTRTETDALFKEAELNNIIVGDFDRTGMEMPSAFPLQKLPFNLYRDTVGTVRHDFKIENELVGGLNLYVDTAKNDTNDGLTVSTAVRTIAKAIAVGAASSSDKIIINLINTVFYKDLSFTFADQTLTKDYVIKPHIEGNRALMTGSDNISANWTTEDTIYKVSSNGVIDVFDTHVVDENGAPSVYELVDSIASVKAKKGSWFSTGTIVYVNTLDGRIPNTQIFCNRDMYSTRFFINDHKLVFKDIDFLVSGKAAQNSRDSKHVTGNENSTFIAHNCKFMLGALNGMASNKVGVSLLFGCLAAYNGTDGFNYHGNLTPNPYETAFEFECLSYKNGRLKQGTNNATTAHDGMSILRIGCIGYECHGPILADVNGCLSVNYNCVMYDSTKATNATRAGFYFDNAAALKAGKAYLIDCSGGGTSTYSLNSDKTIPIYLRKFRGRNIPVGNQIEAY